MGSFLSFFFFIAWETYENNFLLVIFSRFRCPCYLGLGGDENIWSLKIWLKISQAKNRPCSTSSKWPHLWVIFCAK
jgi:hypothetical protein